MNWSRRALRLRSSLLAAIAGWLAGVLCTLPIEASVAWRNTDGQLAWMAETLGLGVIIWGAWTLVFAMIAWLIIAAPLILILAPTWLRAREGRLVVALSLAAVALPAKVFGLFTIFNTYKQFDQHNFFVYSIFGVSYAVVSLLAYLRLEAAADAKASRLEESSNIATVPVTSGSSRRNA